MQSLAESFSTGRRAEVLDMINGKLKFAKVESASVRFAAEGTKRNDDHASDSQLSREMIDKEAVL